jgi:uncharacterized protein YegP (UPF0339 family)
MAHKWEIYKDKAGEFRVRFSYNSEVMFSTEGYSSKQSAMNALESAKKNMPEAEVFDSTAPQSKRKKKAKEPKKALLTQAAEQNAAAVTNKINEIIASSLKVTARYADPAKPGEIIIDVWIDKKIIKSVRMIELDDTFPDGLFQLPDNA